MGSLDEPLLAVNDGVLNPEDIALLTPSDPNLHVEELRKRYKRDGFLYVKNLLPREDVLKAREAYFRMLAPTGILEQDSLVVEGKFNSNRHPDESPGLVQVHRA